MGESKRQASGGERARVRHAMGKSKRQASDGRAGKEQDTGM